MNSENAVSALAALAQPTRLAIFRLLVEAGPQGLVVGKIADALAVAPTTLSFHLKTLLQADLLQSRQDGRFIVYSANFTVMNGLVAFLTDNCCGGNPCTPSRVPDCSTNCSPSEEASS